MSVRSRLFLQMAVVVNAVALVISLICFQAGLVFTPTIVTQSDLNAAIDARRANGLQFSLNSPQHQSEVSKETGGRPDVDQSDIITVISSGNQPAGPEIAERTPLSDDSAISHGSIFRIDQMRQGSGPVSRELLLHDSVEVIMSSSKSIVLTIPKTPEEKQKAIDRYLASATGSFQSLDRDHNEQLTEAELGDLYWKHFHQQGVVQNGNLNFDGFLKHYVWYKNEHFRRNRF